MTTNNGTIKRLTDKGFGLSRPPKARSTSSTSRHAPARHSMSCARARTCHSPWDRARRVLGRERDGSLMGQSEHDASLERWRQWQLRNAETTRKDGRRMRIVFTAVFAALGIWLGIQLIASYLLR